MSILKTLSRANREMQLDSWTPVAIDQATMLHIHKEHGDQMIQPADDLKATAVYVFLQEWCRQQIKGGFAPRREVQSMNMIAGGRGDDPCFTFLFKRSSEAVRFKLTWGGR
jgi:hypothetical protein